MAIKSEIKNLPKSQTPYPKLMISSDNYVVLFSGPKCGTVLSLEDSGIDIIGNHSINWDTDYFKDFHGSITLSNKE